MCLAIPGRIVRISEEEQGLPVAEVDFGSFRRPAQLLYVPEARVGEYVVVQAGFAIRRMSAAEAEENLRYADELERTAAAAQDPARAPSSPGRPVARSPA